MKWIFQAVAELVAMVVAYLTNWLVVLWADERGNLPYWLRYWQTYDNTLDVGWMIDEVPEWARYDYDKHYLYHSEVKPPNSMTPGFVDVLDGNFTAKERFQRYVCRICWLYRNSNYGFSYYVNGRVIDGEKNVVVKTVNEPNNEQWISYVPGNWWNCTWSFFYCRQYCRWFRLRIYLGWKLKGVTSGTQRHMLALAVNPFKPLEHTEEN